jgi:hypothetical protein
MTQQRVVELWKQIESTIDTLTDPLKELFERCYQGKCEKEYIEIVGKLVDITQTDLPMADIKYEHDGRKDIE